MGSAAASLVLYCLEVTRINPMEHNLVFERFLNLERREMPDIDMDFEDDKRNEVMKYCVDRYGKDHIAQIITFGTMGAKAAVRDVTRVLDLPISVGDKLAGIIPTRVGTKIKDAQEIEEVLPELTTTRDNGYKAVKYEKLTAFLLECVKEQQQQINSLSEKIKSLEKNNE